MINIRKTILTMGIIATLIILFQCSVACWAGTFLGEPSLFHGGTAGRFIAMFLFIASIIVLFKATISVAIFAASGLVALAVGFFMDYYELIFWGAFSLVLAFLSFLAREEGDYYEEEIEDDIHEEVEQEKDLGFSEDFPSEREMLLNRRARHYML